ncbi:MAG: J domain-containing protein [Ilumatobacteraceae bacterium]
MSSASASDDYYELLQVHPRASVEVIEVVLKKLASKHHPDRGGDAEMMRKLLEARDVLLNVEARRRYDAAGGSRRSASTTTVHDAVQVLLSESGYLAGYNDLGRVTSFEVRSTAFTYCGTAEQDRARSSFVSRSPARPDYGTLPEQLGRDVPDFRFVVLRNSRRGAVRAERTC